MKTNFELLHSLVDTTPSSASNLLPYLAKNSVQSLAFQRIQDNKDLLHSPVFSRIGGPVLYSPDFFKLSPIIHQYIQSLQFEQKTSSSSSTSEKRVYILETRFSHPSLLGLIQGVAVGITGPLAVTPLDKRQAQLVVLKAGEAKPPIREMFKGYAPAARAAIATRIFSKAAFMGGTGCTASLVSHLTDNPLTIGSTAFFAGTLIENGVAAPTAKVLQEMRVNKLAIHFLSTLRNVVQREGVKSLWRGFTPSTSADIIYNVLFYQAQVLVKKEIEKINSREASNQSLLNGFLSGAVTAFFVCPTVHPLIRIAIEQRTQIEGTSTPPKGIYSTGRDILARGYVQSGLKGAIKEMYKGFMSGLVRMPLMGGTVIATLEGVKLLRDHIKVALATSDNN